MAQRDTTPGEEELESKTLKSIIKVLYKLSSYDPPCDNAYTLTWSPEYLTVLEAIGNIIADIAGNDEKFQQVIIKTSTVVTAKAQGTYVVSEKKVKYLEKQDKVAKKKAKEDKAAKKAAKANYKEAKAQQKANKGASSSSSTTIVNVNVSYSSSTFIYKASEVKQCKANYCNIG